MKVVKKVILYTLGLVLVLAIALTASVFIFKDRILQQFVREANKSLNTPVKIGSMDVTLLDDFPNLSIVCRDVVVEDSYPGEFALLKAKSVAFQLNPLEVWKGVYTIRGLTIRDSETHLMINRKGETNFNIVKERSGEEPAGSVSLSLKNVRLKSTTVYYSDKRSGHEFEFISDQLNSTIETSDDVYLIAAKGDVSTGTFSIGETSLLSNKDFTIETTLRYLNKDKQLIIDPSTLQLGSSSFALQGEYTWRDHNAIDLKAEGQHTDIQTLLSLLPESATASLKKYESSGEVFFKGSLRGEFTPTHNPGISLEFGFKDATITHPEYQAKITKATLRGSFASSDVMSMENATLVLNDISGELNGEAFTSRLVIQNFNDPEVSFRFKGNLEAKSILSFYPIPQVVDANGNLLGDFAFEGRLSWLKSKATAQKATATGSVELHNIGFAYGADKVPVHDLNGTLQFNNNDLALSNLSGVVGNSDFIMNGFFKNIITFLLFDNQPIGIETDFQSKHLDLEQLFTFGFSNEVNDQEYVFSISPNVYLNFNCSIGSLHYKRFNARNIKGDLLVKNQVAVSRNLTFNTMDGAMKMNGIVDATNAKAIDVVSSFELEGIRVDSIFYVFENFKQDFIQDKHLKGKSTAEVGLEMTLNQHLKLFPETLVADISATIREGELNNFEPLQALSKYVDDEGLSKLRFADLKNEIHIENKTIYIPQMDIRSNVTVLQFSGTHTFDQLINYRVVAPLRNKRKINIAEAGSALEEMEGKTKLFLKITGSTDNYKVQYDTEAVRKKLANDFKKEVKELKDAFKLKGQKKKKELEVTDDEFDWN